MAMRFVRGWDFNPGNKQLDLNSLTQDSEVVAALQAAIAQASGDLVVDTDDQTAAQVPFTPAAGVAATDVQGAIVELAGDVAAVPAPNVLLLTAAGAVPGGTAVGTIIVRKTV